jgi:creatinine amidohydrolase
MSIDLVKLCLDHGIVVKLFGKHMSQHPLRHYADMDETYIRTADTSDWIAVLPLGATEQHGAHLPADTDWIIAEGIVNAVIERLALTMPVTFLPVEKIGYSIEHTNRPGVQSLSFHEAIARWVNIGKNLNDFGIRKFVMLNAHGGNAPLMTIVAAELRAQCHSLAVATSWTRFGYPADIVSEQEKAFGIHGGEVETSVMLALRPDLVTMAHARDFPSLQYEMAKTAKHLRAYGPHAFGWMATDLNPNGVTGHAKQGNAYNGRRMIDHAAEGFVELLYDVKNFDVTRFDKD